MTKKEKISIGGYLALIFFLIAVLMTRDQARDTLPAITYNHSSTYVIVNWYDTETELQTALDDNELAGLSDCEHRPDFNTSFCELWLVLPEHYEDDYAFDTIGHEFCHALRGDDCHE